jgi:hypothetical protein
MAPTRLSITYVHIYTSSKLKPILKMSLCRDYLPVPTGNEHLYEITELRHLAEFSVGVTEVLQQHLVQLTSTAAALVVDGLVTQIAGARSLEHFAPKSVALSVSFGLRIKTERNIRRL